MEGVFMAILDFVPVGLFLAASIILQKAFYNKMSKGAFAVFSCGTIMVFTAGFLKALHKLIYFGFNTNFKTLSTIFFPIQTIGFVLAAVGLVAMHRFKQGEGKTYAVGLPALLVGIAALAASSDELPDSSSKLTMVFVALMCLGVAVMYALLGYFSVKIKSIPSLLLLIVAFVCTLGMGYLSTKNEMSDWIKEAVNTTGQACLLVAAILMKKKGIYDANALKGVLKE